MQLISQNGCINGQFEIFQRYGTEVVACVSTRQGGLSSGKFESLNLGFRSGDRLNLVQSNREIFCKSLGINTGKLAWAKQIHSARIFRVTSPGFQGEGDGLITNHTDVFLALTVADCIPVFLFDPFTYSSALLHAGWKGIVSGIVRAGVDSLANSFAVYPENLRAALGPHIRVCCYTVTDEMTNVFPERHLTKLNNGAWSLDLTAHVQEQLVESGIRPSHIEISTNCTSCEGNHFYSYRRDNKLTGRMMALFGHFKKGAGEL